MRLACASSLLLLLVLAPVSAEPVVAEPGPVEIPASVTGDLAKIAKELASLGRAGDAWEVFAVLEAGGAPKRTLDKARQEIGKALTKAKTTAVLAPKPAARLRKTADALARRISAEKGERGRRALAALVLRLSGTNRTAHEALGHVEIDGAWFAPDDVARRERGVEIARALAHARRLPVETEEVPAAHAAYRSLYGEAGRGVRAAHVTILGHEVDAARMHRIARTTLRTLALANWFAHGEVAVPPNQASITFILCDTPEDYVRWAGIARDTGIVDQDHYEIIKNWGFYWHRDYIVARPMPESAQLSMVVWCIWRMASKALYGGMPQACLGAGHVNWLCLSCFGAPMAKLLEIEVDEEGGGGRTKTPDAEGRERRRLRLISQAGLVGTREWLRYLARKEEDPAWSHSMVADYVDVGGVDLLKSTVVVEHLQESRTFIDLVRKTVPKGTPTDADAPPAMAAGLGTSLAELEARFRAWLLGIDEGVAERLDAPEAFDAKATGKWLTWLNGIRRAAADPEQDAPPDLEIDHTLSKGAARHVAYLLENPDEAGKWPGMHDENPDLEGFSPEGARAGRNGVIVFGVADAVDAIDWWMGTFYHRLPLLDPGLMRVGWGFDRKTAVLDVLSLRRPVEAHHVVAWPPDGAKRVPTRFRAGEKPHPVPGEEQNGWGYPITLQLYWQSDDPDVRMTLRRGSAAGDVVPCHYSTPRAPTNPNLAPHAAYCLIPKQHLRRKTTYTVVAEGIPGREPRVWSFQTGS